MTNLLPGAARLNTLWKAVNAASDLREMTRSRRTYVFHVPESITLFLRAENADIRIMRWDRPGALEPTCCWLWRWPLISGRPSSCY